MDVLSSGHRDIKVGFLIGTRLIDHIKVKAVMFLDFYGNPVLCFNEKKA